MKIRHVTLLAFFLLTIISVFVLHRNAEAWCPMGGVESLYSYIMHGTMICSLAATNFFALIAVLLMTLLFKRIFCGYICPLGAIAAFMRWLAKKTGFKQFRVPAKVDKVMAMLKYIVLAVILFFTWKLTELVVRDFDPCFGLLGYSTEEATSNAYIALAVFVVAAFFISMPFCRWICPFAAVMSIFSRFGFVGITRNPQTCTDCKLCTKTCPMGIEVNVIKPSNSVSCIGCMECIDACPVKNQKPLAWKLFGKIALAKPQGIIAVAIPVFIIALILTAGMVKLPTFISERPEAKPDSIGSYSLQIKGVKCAGSAKLFVFFLDRKDLYEVPGYLKISAAPKAGFADVKIQYDKTKTDEQTIRDAVLQPYYDEDEARWRSSPFEIKGYDLLDGGTN